MKNNATNAVFGLGSMGYGIAQSLLRDGHEVYGFDVVEAQVEKLGGEGGLTGTPATCGPELDCAVVVVLNAPQMESVLFGEDGIVPHMKPGACVIACPTVEPAFARDMEARCQAFGVHYLDAPISGGAAKSAQGQLTVMASGSPESFEVARASLDAMAETVFELGDSAGAGSSMKAVNQLLAGVHIAAMAEALTFGLTQGMDLNQVIQVISKCAGTSWMFENRGPNVASGDYSPRSAVNIWPKDLGIVLDIAKDAKFSAPLTAAALQQFVAAAGSGLGGEDDSAVAKIYARNAGLTLPEG